MPPKNTKKTVEGETSKNDSRIITREQAGLEAVENQKNTATSLPKDIAGTSVRQQTHRELESVLEAGTPNDHHEEIPAPVPIVPEMIGVSEAQFQTLFTALSKKFEEKKTLDLNTEPSQTHSNAIDDRTEHGRGEVQ